MTIRPSVVALLCLLSTAKADTVLINPPIDTTQFDPAGAAAAVAASMPQPSGTAPPMEAVAGAAGASTTYRRSDAVQPRITRSRTLTTASDGTATFDWTAQGSIDANSSPNFGITYTGGAVPVCVATAQTITSVSIKCTLQVTVVVVGISVLGAPVAANGLRVGVTMIPPS